MERQVLSDIFCIFIVLVIYLDMKKYKTGIGLQGNLFEIATLMTLASTFVDIVFQFALLGNLTAGFSAFFMHVFYLITPIILVVFAVYTALTIENSVNNHFRTAQIVYAVPLLVYSILWIVNIFTGFMFSYVSNKGIVLGDHYVLVLILYALYSFGSIAYSIFRHRIIVPRKRIITMILCNVIVLIAIVLQLILDVLLINYAFTLVLLIKYLGYQNRREIIDPLTGVMSRKSCVAKIEESLSNKHSRGEGALLLADVDNLKVINDSYGHSTGDECLAAVARQLKNSFRGKNVVGRIGGDEFVLFLVKADDKEQVADELNNLIGAIQKDISAIVGHDVSINSSISIGICHATKEDKKFEQLYKRADRALYQAKDNGKKRAEFCM